MGTEASGSGGGTASANATVASTEPKPENDIQVGEYNAMNDVLTTLLNLIRYIIQETDEPTEGYWIPLSRIRRHTFFKELPIKRILEVCDSTPSRVTRGDGRAHVERSHFKGQWHFRPGQKVQAYGELSEKEKQNMKKHFV